MKKIVFLLYRAALSLRYRIKVVNKKVLDDARPKLIYPNHQAHVDHQIIVSQAITKVDLAPLAAGRYFKNPVLRLFLKWMDAIPVSDIQGGERDMGYMETVRGKIGQVISKGKSVLLYPGGMLTGQGKEKIFGKQAAYLVTKSFGEKTQVVAVRISGLWGSSLSRAWHGEIPKVLPGFLKGLLLIITNLIFFMPRRKVTVEFIDITDEAIAKSKQGKKEFNDFLEKTYNQNGAEQVKFVRYHFLAPKLNRELPETISGSEEFLNETTAFEEKDFDEETVATVLETVRETVQEPGVEISFQSHLNFDLHIDSLGLVTIIEGLEGKFPEMPQPDYPSLKTIGDLCALVSGKFSLPEKFKESKLHIHKSKVKPIGVDLNMDIVGNFLGMCKEAPKENLAWDKILGSMDRKTMLLKASVVSLIIKKEVQGKYVGIMLPSLQSTVLLLASCYLAGKTPVMFNWTSGPANILHCLKQTNPDKILTAGTFFKKIEELLPKQVKEKCIFFEQKVRATKLGTKLKGVFRSKFPNKAFKPFKLDDEAVILFTSGSESRPKAVPLTHGNVISNIDGVLKVITINNNNILLSFLPPFHSFGYTVLSIIPLVTGLKSAYTPNPVDRFELQRVIRHVNPNILITAPTFLKMILNALTPEEMKTFWLTVTGAEALHPSIIEMYKEYTKEGAYILEGYGITECSPIISINPFEKQKIKSVGKVIGGMEWLIADVETNQALETGKEGMIMVSGKSVFNGYMDKSIKSPFVEINGKTFYKTGDLGHLDQDGYLFITGRLKRFIKIGRHFPISGQ